MSIQSDQVPTEVVVETIKIAPAGRVLFLNLFPKVSAGKVVLERIGIEVSVEAVRRPQRFELEPPYLFAEVCFLGIFQKVVKLLISIVLAGVLDSIVGR